jgi:hypothetical protein
MCLRTVAHHLGRCCHAERRLGVLAKAVNFCGGPRARHNRTPQNSHLGSSGRETLYCHRLARSGSGLDDVVDEGLSDDSELDVRGLRRRGATAAWPPGRPA